MFALFIEISSRRKFIFPGQSCQNSLGITLLFLQQVAYFMFKFVYKARKEVNIALHILMISQSVFYVECNM